MVGVAGMNYEADTSKMAVREELSKQRIQQGQEVAISLVRLRRERPGWLKHGGRQRMVGQVEEVGRSQIIGLCD